MPILPILSTAFHSPEHSFQYILSLAFILSGLSPIIRGAIIDGIRIRAFIITATISSIIFLLLVACSTNIILFGIFYIMGCIMINGLLGCARMLPFLYLKEEVYIKRALSLMMLGGYSAAFFAPFIGGWVYHLFNWREVFFVVPIWLLAILLLALSIVKLEVRQPLLIYFQLNS
ncbi:MAG: MFS transporter [Gammaproteobacteria bacterium]|nr:MFS transporter [Gammaproteobacteria bacterium]